MAEKIQPKRVKGNCKNPAEVTIPSETRSDQAWPFLLSRASHATANPAINSSVSAPVMIFARVAALETCTSAGGRSGQLHSIAAMQQFSMTSKPAMMSGTAISA